MPYDPLVEDLELSLIEADANDAVRALLAHSDDPNTDVINMIAFPAAALVAEESFNYFGIRRRTTRLGSLDGELFKSFRHSLKKVRSRLKLFDDTDAGEENLVSFMALVRKQSETLFAHPTSKILQFISRGFRPDLGAFFAGDHMVATSHAALPALGFTPASLKALRPGHFREFGKFIHGFSRSMGAHFANLSQVLSLRGRALNLKPEPVSIAVSLTRNDFVGDRFYRHVERSFQEAQPDRVPALTLCLAQVNAALHVLPTLMSVDSNLLRRVQFLAAHHGTKALQTTFGTLPPWLERDPTPILLSQQLRNIMAHYELRDAGHHALGSSTPLHAAIASSSCMSAEDVAVATRERLLRISEFLDTGLSKSSLRSCRAALGEHT